MVSFPDDKSASLLFEPKVSSPSTGHGHYSHGRLSRVSSVLELTSLPPASRKSHNRADMSI